MHRKYSMLKLYCMDLLLICCTSYATNQQQIETVDFEQQLLRF